MAKGIVKSMQPSKTVVLQLLKADEKYRDEDEPLVARYWNNQIVQKGKDPKVITAYEFLSMYAKGELVSAEYIVRQRRKLQEDNPELRGKRWNERHGLSEDLRKNINEL